MWAITKFWNGGGDWRGRACRCLSRIGASSSPHGCMVAVWSVPGCGWAGGCGYWCWSEYESELGEDDGWLLPLLDVLASSISRRRSYTSTTFFLFMVDRWSMPLLLQREREWRSEKSQMKMTHSMTAVVVAVATFSWQQKWRTKLWQVY